MENKIKESKKPTSAFLHGIKNASYMGMGNVVSQAIAVVGFIFIARLFGPEKYGVYATVIAFVTFFHLFVLQGLSKVIVREGSKKIDSFRDTLEDAVGFRLIFIIITFLLCIVACFFTKYPVTTKVLIIIFSTEIIYFGLDSYLSTIYQTTEKMQYLAYFSVLTRILATGFSILFLYMKAGVLIILLVNLISKFSVLVINYSCSRKLVKFKFGFGFDLSSDILKAVLIFSLMGFINTLAIRIDLLMISFLSTSTDVGIYGVAHEIGKEGLMLRNIIATAFFPIAVKFLYSNTIKIKKLFFYSLMLFLVVVAGCVLLSFFVQDLVVLVFGMEYSYSGYILKYLVFYLAFAFFTLPLTTYLQAAHYEHLLLIVYTITALTNIPLNIIFFHKFGLIGIAYSTLIVFFVQSLLISFFAIKKMSKQRVLT